MPASLEFSIAAALLQASAVTDIVGPHGVRPLAMNPADARPYATYSVTDRTYNPTIADGAAAHVNAEFEIGCYADTYADCVALAEAVRAALDSFDATVEGIELTAFFDAETDVEQAFDEPAGESRPFYLRVLTFSGLYRAA